MMWVMESAKADRDAAGRFLPGHSVQPSPAGVSDKGLARALALDELTPEQLRKVLSGYLRNQITLDREKLLALKLLGEYHGLWGSHRKPPPDDEGGKPESFDVR